MNNDDLILISLKAQLDYIAPRIYSKRKTIDFIKEMNWWISQYSENASFVPSLEDMDKWLWNKEGTNLALDIVKDIIYSIETRYD